LPHWAQGFPNGRELRCMLAMMRLPFCFLFEAN
jgi:hypothetical protein